MEDESVLSLAATVVVLSTSSESVMLRLLLNPVSTPLRVELGTQSRVRLQFKSLLIGNWAKTRKKTCGSS